MTYTISCPHCGGQISYTREQLYRPDHTLLKECPTCKKESRLVMSDDGSDVIAECA
jgi:endogenous inhibitor of DNA gyrase (YacG/DUF329 family)